MNVDLPLLERRATFRPNSLDTESRTVDVVFTTGATVRRQALFGEPFDEELSVSRDAVDLSRLNNGAPLLDGHQAESASSVIGVVVPGSARIENGVGTAKVRFSSREDVEPLFRDVQDGILTGISVGYSVQQYSVVERDGQPNLHRADFWTPLELSAVAIPADASAGFRSVGGEYPCRVVRSHSEAEDTSVQNQTAGSPAVDGGQAAIEAERQRGLTINSNAKRLGVTPEFAEALITEGRSVDSALVALIEQSQKQEAQRAELAAKAEAEPTLDARVTHESAHLEKRFGAFQEQILARAGRGEWTDGAREVRHYKLLDMAKEHLEARGIETRGRTDREIASMAIRPVEMQKRVLGPLGGLHVIGDFPNLLADTCERSLLRGYKEFACIWRPFVMMDTVSDLKPKSYIRFGDAPMLEDVDEHGEYKNCTLDESAEQVSIQKGGCIVGITLEALICDQLSAFTRVPEMFGRSAARREEKKVYDLLLSNPTMATDGLPVFDAAHNNDNPGIGGGPDAAGTQIQLGRNNMRKQTNFQGQVIGCLPRWVIIPCQYEFATNQLLGGVPLSPQTAGQVVPNYIRAMTEVVCPRIDSAAVSGDLPGGPDTWFMIADPNEIETIVGVTLEGEEAVFLDTAEGWRIDGMEWKIRHWIGFNFVDYRGIQRFNS